MYGDNKWKLRFQDKTWQTEIQEDIAGDLGWEERKKIFSKFVVVFVLGLIGWVMYQFALNIMLNNM